jgi:hypothetical protein
MPVTPVAEDLVALGPVVLEPVVLEPVVLEPVVLEPVVLEPVALEPVALEPVVLEPVVLEPVVRATTTTGGIITSSPRHSEPSWSTGRELSKARSALGLQRPKTSVGRTSLVVITAQGAGVMACEDRLPAQGRAVRSATQR